MEGILYHVADEEGQEEDDSHDGQENRDAQPFIGQVAVDGVRSSRLRRLIDDDFMDDFFDEGVFLRNDIRFKDETVGKLKALDQAITRRDLRAERLRQIVEEASDPTEDIPQVPEI